MTVITPPMTQLRIDEVYIFISSGETGEGVCAMIRDGLSIPLIAADEARMRSLLPIARQIAHESGKRVKLIKLSQRTELMTFEPNETTQ